MVQRAQAPSQKMTFQQRPAAFHILLRLDTAGYQGCQSELSCCMYQLHLLLSAGAFRVCLPFPVSAHGPGRPSLDMSKPGKGPRAYSALDEEDDIPVDLTDAPVDQVGSADQPA